MKACCDAMGAAVSTGTAPVAAVPSGAGAEHLSAVACSAGAILAKGGPMASQLQQQLMLMQQPQQPHRAGCGPSGPDSLPLSAAAAATAPFSNLHMSCGLHSAFFGPDTSPRHLVMDVTTPEEAHIAALEAAAAAENDLAAASTAEVEEYSPVPGSVKARTIKCEEV